MKAKKKAYASILDVYPRYRVRNVIAFRSGLSQIVKQGGTARVNNSTCPWILLNRTGAFFIIKKKGGDLCDTHTALDTYE